MGSPASIGAAFRFPRGLCPGRYVRADTSGQNRVNHNAFRSCPAILPAGLDRCCPRVAIEGLQGRALL